MNHRLVTSFEICKFKSDVWNCLDDHWTDYNTEMIRTSAHALLVDRVIRPGRVH